MSIFWLVGCNYECRNVPNLAVYAHAHFEHCCDCAAFNINYDVYFEGQSVSSNTFGSVDVSGCGDIYDTQVGRKLLVPAGTNWDEIRFTSTCESGGVAGCSTLYPSTNGCHDGMSFEFSNENGEILGDTPISTSTVAKITLCNLFKVTSPAP